MRKNKDTSGTESTNQLALLERRINEHWLLQLPASQRRQPQNKAAELELQELLFIRLCRVTPQDLEEEAGRKKMENMSETISSEALLDAAGELIGRYDAGRGVPAWNYFNFLYKQKYKKFRAQEVDLGCGSGLQYTESEYRAMRCLKQYLDSLWLDPECVEETHYARIAAACGWTADYAREVVAMARVRSRQDLAGENQENEEALERQSGWDTAAEAAIMEYADGIALLEDLLNILRVMRVDEKENHRLLLTNRLLNAGYKATETQQMLMDCEPRLWQLVFFLDYFIFLYGSDPTPDSLRYAFEHCPCAEALDRRVKADPSLGLSWVNISDRAVAVYKGIASIDDAQKAFKKFMAEVLRFHRLHAAL